METMYRLTTSLLALAPMVLGSPISWMAPRNVSSGCTADSLNNFAWQVVDFDFHASYIFSTPAHQNSWGYASFNLSNPALPGVVASCNAASSQINDFFYGTPSYTCNFDGESGPAPASFTFNRPTGELVIDQTWVCDDNDPTYPTTFSASGSTNLTLECTTTTSQNPDWQVGDIYSDTEVKCGLVTFEVKPSLMTAVA